MKSISIITFLCLASLSPLFAKPEFKVVSSQDRKASATEHLAGEPNHIAIYTKGLVCSSCGIGLRIHLKKLAGIDRLQFNKGVHLDASKQLIILAYQPGIDPDPAAIRDAIKDAGYEAAHYYRWDGEMVAVHPFEEAK